MDPQSTPVDEICRFDGNPDLYGLGIRSGVYITAFATAIAHAFEQEAAYELCKVAGLFQFAVLVALVRETVTNPDLYAVEALVTYIFSLASLAINPMQVMRLDSPGDTADQDQDRARDRDRDNKRLNLLERHTSPSLLPVLRQLTVLAIDAYQAWFWWVGLDRLRRLPCARTDTFFFVRADMYGSFRTFGKAFSIFMLVFVVVILGLMLAFRRRRVDKQIPADARPMVGLVTAPGKLIGLAGLISMVVSAVELTLKWNNVQGVNSIDSAGQLIPLILGIGTFIGMVLNWERPFRNALVHEETAETAP